jgi:hypothetical protein
MKFTKSNDKIGIEGTRAGFEDRDIAYLNKQIHLPRTQIWSYEQLEDEIEPEDKVYQCAICKSKLDYVKYLDAYRCGLCIEFYDTNIQDTPLKDIEDFKLVPYSDQVHYPVFDENDLMTAFVENIHLNNIEEQEEIETRTYDNPRVQKIHVKGTFADAIKDGVLSAKKKAEDDELA